MSRLLDALDQPAPQGMGDLGGSWDTTVLEALSAVVADSAERDLAAEHLTRDRAWALLSWAEGACSWAVRSRSTVLIERVVQSLALLDGKLDERDLVIVATLARRAALRLGATLEDVARSAGYAGEPPPPGWVLMASDELPSTYTEIGGGSSFEFRREPSTFDPVALEKRLRDDRQSASP